MAEELRYIVLTNEEFMAALKVYRNENQGYLPRGKFVGWSVDADSHLHVLVEMKTTAHATALSFKLDSIDVAQILIGFCIAHKIPVPRLGKKDWHIHEQKMSLRIRFNQEELLSERYDEYDLPTEFTSVG